MFIQLYIGMKIHLRVCVYDMHACVRVILRVRFDCISKLDTIASPRFAGRNVLSLLSYQ